MSETIQGLHIMLLLVTWFSTVNKSLMKLYLEGSHPLKHSLHLFCDIPCNAAWPSEILKSTDSAAVALFSKPRASGRIHSLIMTAVVDIILVEAVQMHTCTF